MDSSKNTYTSSNTYSAPLVEKVMLPTQVIEKPVAVHENIRKEMIEEVQPVFNVEKLKTEIHQVTQPLYDKEVRPVSIENRTFATEILPEVQLQGRGNRTAEEFSTTKYLDTANVVVEKPAMYREVERKQVIEEIQPVVYKETVVPTVIQETKPIYQKVVEGPVYTQNTLPAREVDVRSPIHPGYVPDNTVVAPITERVSLPTQVIEKPVAVHENIRKETIEEIQPVVNVEKLKTEVHQITAPLFDKEVKPVMVEKRMLAQEILPEVLIEGRGTRAIDDHSTTQYLDTKSVLVEKAPIITEVEKRQVIEEIQPVIYKETVVPTVIRETKPVYQKIVEGPVYSHQTLPAQSLHGSNYHYPTNVREAPIEIPSTVPVVVRQVETVPAVLREVEIPIRDTSRSTSIPVVPQHQPELHRKEIIEDVTTTTTTTTVAPVLGGLPETHHKHHLFHRNKADTHSTQHSTYVPNDTRSIGSTGLPATTHSHAERLGPQGEKIIEDTTTSTTHTQKVVPL